MEDHKVDILAKVMELGVAKARCRTGVWRSWSFASWGQAGYSQGDSTPFCFDVGIYKLVARLKILQEEELQKGQILIIFILKGYIFKDFTVTHCRCVALVSGELHIRTTKGLMDAINQRFLAWEFLTFSCSIEKGIASRICHSTELNHCIYNIKKVLDLAPKKIAVWLWATLFCICNILLQSQGNDHSSLTWTHRAIKDTNKVDEKMFLKT